MNFTIWWLFIWMVVKFLFVEQDNQSSIATNIIAFVIAGIAVQLSWFLVWAVIDIATIMTISAGSMPSTIISQDPQMQWIIRQQTVRIPEKITLNLWWSEQDTLLDVEERIQDIDGTWYRDIDLDDFLDTISPRHDSMAWPLVYIWSSVFHIQEYLYRTQYMPSDTDWSDLIATMLIKFGILIMYTFAMVVIFVINIIRVVYIWIFVALAPIFIGFYVLGAFWSDFLKINLDLVKDLSVESILKLIFAPVLYTLYMWMVLIVVVTMQRIIWSDEFDGTWGKWDISVKWNTIEVLSHSTTIVWDLRPTRKDDTQTTMVDLILTVLTLVLLYGMVWLVAKTSPLGTEIITKAQDFGNSLLQQIPIWSTSIWWIWQFASQKIWSNTIKNFFDVKVSEDADNVLNSLWIEDWFSKSTETELIQNSSIKRPEEFLAQYKEKLGDAKFNNPTFLDSQISGPIDKFVWSSTDSGRFRWEPNRKRLLTKIDKSPGQAESKKRIENILKNENLKNISDLDGLLTAMTNNTVIDTSRQKLILQQLFTELTWVTDTKILTPIINKDTFKKAQLTSKA